MATHAEIRRIAMALPGTDENRERFGFSVLNKGKWKGYAWSWAERVHPKKPRVINKSVLAVRVTSLADKEVLLSMDTEKFFTEPHYDGFPAILVRLSAVSAAEMRPLLKDAWRTVAPKEPHEAKPAARRKRRR
jgi:hypothetical protein